MATSGPTIDWGLVVTAITGLGMGGILKTVVDAALKNRGDQRLESAKERSDMLQYLREKIEALEAGLSKCQETHNEADKQILELTKRLAISDTKIDILLQRDGDRVNVLEKDKQVATGIAEALLKNPQFIESAKTHSPPPKGQPRE